MPTKPVTIILIGYRATGKTSVGMLLAEKLGFSFIDADHAIEQKENQCISDMVAEHGWDYFRTKEKEMLLELAEKKEHIIATGGGAILHQDIWKTVKESGVVIWLKADTQTICTRLAGDEVSDTQRPSLTGADILKEVSSVLATRTPLYATSSHITVDATNSIEDIVADVLQQLGLVRK